MSERQNLEQRFARLAVTCLCLSLCLFAQSQPPKGGNSQTRQGSHPVLPPKSYDGFWLGTTNQVETLSFSVVGGRVTLFSVEGRFETDCPRTDLTSARGQGTVDLQIANGFFSLARPSHVQSVTMVSLTGAFESAGSARGTLKMAYEVPWAPGCYKDADTTWTAKKIDPADFDGTWTGPWQQYTGTEGRVTFSVANGQVKSIAFEGLLIDKDRRCNARVNTTSTVTIPLVANTFSADIGAGPGGTSYSITATLNSASTASGSLSVRYVPNVGEPFCDAQLLSGWQAKKEPKPQ